MKKVIENPEDHPTLMEEFRAGENIAFETFFNFYQNQLLGFAINMIKNGYEAREIVSDVFFKLWLKHEGFETVFNVKSFLYIAVKNRCLNYLAHKDAVSRFEEIYQYETSADENPGILDKLIRSELVSEVYKAIEGLPEKRKEIFKLSYVYGYDNLEIATILNHSPNTVAEQLWKARVWLRRYFSGVQEDKTNQKPEKPTIDNTFDPSKIAKILENSNSFPSIKRLLEIGGIKKTAFQRIFKAKYGLTPLQYFMKFRLEAAKNDILAGKPIKAVIEGYTGYSNFVIGFKNHFGYHPKTLIPNCFH